jgi:hypothetical protein
VAVAATGGQQDVPVSPVASAGTVRSGSGIQRLLPVIDDLTGDSNERSATLGPLRSPHDGSRILKEQASLSVALAAVMAHSRAVELARRPKQSIYVG